MPRPSFVCWDARDAREVLGFDAEDVPDDVFLGVHTERDLFLVGAGSRDEIPEAGSSRTRVTAREFLEAFRSTPDAKAVVLGESGAGKSHLIQWLWLNLPPRPDTHVLRIPKTGISLRSVVREIISILPADRQGAYRDRLESAGYDQMDARQRVRALTAMIALSIAADDPAAHGASTPDQVEEETYLARHLPSLFNDPHLQETHFGVRGGLVEQLVEHVFDTARNYVSAQGRRGFTAADLPLEGIEIAKTAGPTRAILQDLSSFRDLIPVAVRIVNRNLNAAISRVLNFTGDQLVELTTEVREVLHERGQTLVLLIEDFARLQGLDVPLAQALTVPTRQGSRRLCEMRWAMAVTRGYYEQSRDSLKTRMNFVVDMDVPSSEAGGASTFAARYMNAVRVGRDELRRWHAETADGRAGLANACDRCEMRDGCHPVFGSVEGIGLYPFTERSLTNMIARADPNHAERFNPRKLLMSVLTPVFVEYREDLREVRFPPPALLQRLGGGRLSPLDRQAIEDRDPADAARQRTLFELWGASDRLAGVSPGIFKAFGLEDLSGLEPPSDRVDHSTVGGEPDVERGRTSVDRDLAALGAWANGSALPQGLATQLRELVYHALEDFIDWDAAGLERAAFAKRTGTAETAFRSVNIEFDRQPTGGDLTSFAVGLRIPQTSSPDDLKSSAVALEGLWKFRRSGNWAFPNGAQFAVAVGEALTRWADQVVEGLARWPRTEEEWSPVEVAVEVLAVGAALAGRPPAASPSSSDVVDALFAPLPEGCPSSSRTWATLYAEVRTRHQSLVDVVQARASGGKGGQAGAFVDPSRIMPVVERLRRDWRLAAKTPAVLAGGRDVNGRMVRLHRLIAGKIAEAATEEHASRVGWLQDVRGNVPPGTRRADIVSVLSSLETAISSGGLAVPRAILHEFREALEEFRHTQFDSAVRAAESIARADDPLSVLPRLVRDKGNAVDVSRRLFASVAVVLAAAEAGAAEQLSTVRTQVGESLVADQASIGSDLDELAALLTEVAA